MLTTPLQCFLTEGNGGALWEQVTASLAWGGEGEGRGGVGRCGTPRRGSQQNKI